MFHSTYFQNMSFFKSLAFKNVIIYLLIFLVGLGMVGYLLLSNSSKRILESAENQLLHNGSLVEIQIRDYVHNLVFYMDYLSKSPVLYSYLEKRDSSSLEFLVQNYLTLVQSNKNFSQIRYIRAADGKEVARVDQKSGKSEIVSVSKLQYKQEKQYFIKAAKLSSGELYFSPINLNREHGEISQPFTPTLRVARPIYHKDKLQGVLVINTNLIEFFNRLNITVGSDFILRMVNEDGYYLMHENPDSTFIFDTEPLASKPQFKLAINEIASETILSRPEELMSIHKINVEGMSYDLIYTVIANRSNLLSAYYKWRKKSLLIILFAAMLFILISFSILNRQLKSLRRLTDSMKQFPLNRKVSELPINRDDEIGDLAKGYEEMANIINQQLQSIEGEKSLAELAERNKSEFIENISHEIRNPLQSIMGLCDMLERNNPNSNQIDILNSIKLNANNLNGLVNNILDFQNVINGNINIELKWTSINDLMNEIVLGNQFKAKQKSISISTNLDNRLQNLEMELNQLRICQVLNNLISNAISHSPVGSNISVKCELKAGIEQDEKLVFSVIDEGPGVNQETLLKLTERYYSNHETRSPDSNFGLGLTIVNEILSQLNSKLKVRSEKNRGATFYFELTAKKRIKSDHQIAAKKSVELKGLNVLVVEDDIQVLNNHKYLLKDCHVVYAKSYDSINLPFQQLDLLITDFKFENDDLINHLKFIRSIITDSTLIAIVSGVENPNLNKVKEISSAVTFLKKPFDNDYFLEMISLGLAISKFGLPEIDTIKKDYDYQENKYKPAIQLLLNEWTNYAKRLTNCIRKQDTKEFDEILHKFNTTLRRLKLTKLEEKLVSIRDDMESNEIDLKKEVTELNKIMKSYFNFIEKLVSNNH